MDDKVIIERVSNLRRICAGGEMVLEGHGVDVILLERHNGVGENLCYSSLFLQPLCLWRIRRQHT